MACPAKGLEASAGGADTTLEARPGLCLSRRRAGSGRCASTARGRAGGCGAKPKPGKPRKCRWRSHPALEGLTGGDAGGTGTDSDMGRVKRGRTREGRCASTRPGRGCRRGASRTGHHPKQARPARKRGWPRHSALEGWAGGGGSNHLSKPKPAVPGGAVAAAAQATEGLTGASRTGHRRIATRRANWNPPRPAPPERFQSS